MISWNWSSAYAAGRNLASYAAGAVSALVAVGLLSGDEGAQLSQSIEHIVRGVGELATGVTGLVAVLMPFYTSWRAAHAASPDQQAKSVAASMGQASGEAINAVAKSVAAAIDKVSNGTRLDVINAVGTMPEVKRVVADLEVAQATSSPKVTAS